MKIKGLFGISLSDVGAKSVCLRRYLNSSAAKALFRQGRIEDAEAMAAKFTKHGDQLNGLTEMQCMWYEIECGNAYIRRREYGKVQHFLEFSDVE